MRSDCGVLRRVRCASPRRATRGDRLAKRMPAWLIPMVYRGGSLVIAATLSRLEHTYFLSYYNDIAVDAVLAWLSVIATGMMSFTAVAFSIAYITVQFN